MNRKAEHPIDRFYQDRILTHDLTLDPTAWVMMEQTLDDPGKKSGFFFFVNKKNTYLLLISLGLVLISMVGSYVHEHNFLWTQNEKVPYSTKEISEATSQKIEDRLNYPTTPDTEQQLAGPAVDETHENDRSTEQLLDSHLSVQSIEERSEVSDGIHAEHDKQDQSSEPIAITPISSAAASSSERTSSKEEQSTPIKSTEGIPHRSVASSGRSSESVGADVRSDSFSNASTTPLNAINDELREATVELSSLDILSKIPLKTPALRTPLPSIRSTSQILPIEKQVRRRYYVMSSILRLELNDRPQELILASSTWFWSMGYNFKSPHRRYAGLRLSYAGYALERQLRFIRTSQPVTLNAWGDLHRSTIDLSGTYEIYLSSRFSMGTQLGIAVDRTHWNVFTQLRQASGRNEIIASNENTIYFKPEFYLSLGGHVGYDILENRLQAHLSIYHQLPFRSTAIPNGQIQGYRINPQEFVRFYDSFERSLVENLKYTSVYLGIKLYLF